MYLLLSLAFLSIFVSKSLGSGVEILTILIFLYQLITKKNKSYPQVKSYKIGVILSFSILFVSLLNVGLGKIALKDLSILRHDFFPICFAGITVFSLSTTKDFKTTIEKFIPWIFLGILLTTLSNFYQAFNSTKGLTLLFSGKRFGGITGINELAYSLSGVYPLLLSYSLYHLKQIKRIHYLSLVTIFLLFLSVYFTRSRGPLLAILVVTPVCFFYYFKKFFYYSVGISSLVITVFTFLLMQKPNFNSRYFLPLNTKSNLQRLVQYQVAFDLMKDYPILGVGLKKYSDRSVEYKEALNYNYQSFRSHAHNTFLHIGAENGALVGLLFFFFFIYLAYESLLIKDLLARGIFSSSFLVFILQSMYDHVYQVFFAVLISTILSLYWVYQRDFIRRRQ